MSDVKDSTTDLAPAAGDSMSAFYTEVQILDHQWLRIFLLNTSVIDFFATRQLAHFQRQRRTYW